MRGKPKARTIDEYLAPLEREQRAALERLRQAIHATAPEAEECISYGIPAFRLNGKLLVFFGAAKNHCSFYPTSYPIELYKNDLKAYGLARGTIRFEADKPLSLSLIRKLVRARMKQLADAQSVYGRRPPRTQARSPAKRKT